LHGGKGIEEELRDVGESNGVAASDALAGELFDEMAEEAIHGVRAGEVLDPSKKVSGNGFRIESDNLAPDSATLHLAYAASFLLSQNYSAAEAQARQSLKLWPENADAHGSLALSLTAQKRFAEAESESREALRIFPDHHPAMFTLGLSLTHEQKYREAIPVLQNAIAALSRIPVLRKLLGISLFEAGEIDEGASQLGLYVKNAPEDAEGHYYLGVAFRSKGRSEEARLQFAEAFRLQPNNAQYEAAAHPDASRNATDAVSGPKPEDSSISDNL